jgi:hypothetical protein
MLFIFLTAGSYHSRFENIEIKDTFAYSLYLWPNNNIQDNPCSVEVINSRFLRNIGPADAFIKGRLNSQLVVKDSYFEENFTMGRGGVAMADKAGNHY